MRTLEVAKNSYRETIWAVGVSILLHLFLIVGIALAMALPIWRFSLPKVVDKIPIEMTIIPNKFPQSTQPTYVRTTPQNLQKSPKKTLFESDNNTQAASSSVPSGTQEIPSAEGRDGPVLELENRDHSAGKENLPSQPEKLPDEQPRATPAPTPLPKPELSLREVPKTDNHALPKKQPTPSRSTTSGFQPETRVTRLRGNISNRGRASVDATATPLGRYKKTVSEAIGSRWYYYVNQQMGLLNIGTVDIRFQIGPDGKAQKVTVLTNTSNESFASVSITSILEADIPPIPPEVVKLLDNGRLEIDYSFTILNN